MLAFSIGWIRAYSEGGGSAGCAAHRRVCDGFSGPKREVTNPAATVKFLRA
jgi:hypothetical protein